MDQQDSIFDPVFDDMVMPKITLRRKFLRVCRETFPRPKSQRKISFYDEWKVYVSLLLQMGAVGLHDANIIRKIITNSADIKTDKHGRISELKLATNSPSALPASRPLPGARTPRLAQLHPRRHRPPRDPRSPERHGVTVAAVSNRPAHSGMTVTQCCHRRNDRQRDVILEAEAAASDAARDDQEAAYAAFYPTWRSRPRYLACRLL